MTSGLIKPSTDFRAVRDGRNSQVFYVDVALDTARSAAASTALVLPISGNSFYIDANPADGNALVHFQDTNFDRGPAPLYVSPGAIFNIPFTQVLIENSAQAGKKIRIAYGIDVDFQPGSVSQIAVTNAGGYTAVRPEAPSSFSNVVGALVANTAVNVVLPASNTNGLIVLAAGFTEPIVGVNFRAALISKSSAPASPADGDALIMGTGNWNNGVNAGGSFLLPIEQYVSAGNGLYWISDSASSATSGRFVRYKLL